MTWFGIVHKSDGSVSAVLCPDCADSLQNKRGLVDITDLQGCSDRKCASCDKQVAVWLSENEVKNI